MSWEGFGLKAVEVEGDSKMFEVQLPATIPNDSVRVIAALAKALEQGQASLDLYDVDGRLTMFLTISRAGFPFAIDVKGD